MIKEIDLTVKNLIAPRSIVVRLLIANGLRCQLFIFDDGAFKIMIDTVKYDINYLNYNIYSEEQCCSIRHNYNSRDFTLTFRAQNLTINFCHIKKNYRYVCETDIKFNFDSKSFSLFQIHYQILIFTCFPEIAKLLNMKSSLTT